MPGSAECAQAGHFASASEERERSPPVDPRSTRAKLVRNDGRAVVGPLAVLPERVDGLMHKMRRTGVRFHRDYALANA